MDTNGNGSGRAVEDHGVVRERRTNQVDRRVTRLRAVPIPLAMAKVKVGEAVGQAIGDQPLKAYGDKSNVKKVCSGERVPEYLAQIYRDRAARRRFALSLLEDDDGVRVRTVVEWDEEKAG